MHGSAPACVALVMTAMLAPAATGAAGNPPDSSHGHAVRDYLIVRYCGLETERVRAGFRIEVIGLVERGDVSPEAARIERRAAAEYVRREWRNRGMGSRDPRCLTEGQAAVDRFLSVLDARN